MSSIIVPKRSLILPRGSRSGLALPQSQRGFMLVNPSRFGGGSGAVNVTWNPLDKSTLISLGSLDKLANKGTAANEWGSVRATLARSSGKWYFEIVSASSGGSAIDTTHGIATSAMLLTGSGGGSANGGFVGSGAAGVSYGIYQRDGTKATNNTFSAYGSGWSTGSTVIGVAVDFTNGKIFFAKGNVYQNSGDPVAGTNPAFTGISGTFYPATSLFNIGGISSTIQAGSSELTYSPPTGYTAWGG